MTLYAGNLIGQTGSDGTTATGVAANYRKMTPQQTYGVGEAYSNFGTRQLAWFQVSLANVYTNYATGIDSLFGQAVRGLQLNTEVYFISTPHNGSGSGDYFVVAVAYDTTPDNSKEDDSDMSPTQAKDIKAIVDRATSGNSTVTAYTF